MTKKKGPETILPDDSTRTSGRAAQRLNIAAAQLVAETVRTTLGPKGMDKMIVDPTGEVTVTNDGVTILNEMQLEHPTAKMIVEIARAQEASVGDGTTTAVVLAGELLKNAERLLDDTVHPTIIAKGYRLAATESHRLLDAMSKDVKADDKETLVKVAATATTGKGAEVAKEHLARLVVKALTTVAEETSRGYTVDQRDVTVTQKSGGRVEESTLVKGVLLDKERCHPSMPRRITNAKILLLDTPLEIKNTETNAQITINDPSQLQSLLDMEENLLQEMTARVVASGANVLISQKGIDDAAQYALGKAGVLAVRRVSKGALERLAKATGATITSKLADVNANVLGSAGLVEERTVGEEALIAVEECRHPKAVTLLARGGTPHVAAEVARAIEDALGVTTAALTTGKVVAGAGAPEVKLSLGLQQYASTLSGKEALAVESFAAAMNVIPLTLAENAGINAVAAVKRVHKEHEEEPESWAGIDVYNGETMDAWKEGVVEPLLVKTEAVGAAAEVAVLILRIDDIIKSERKLEGRGFPPGYPILDL